MPKLYFASPRDLPKESPQPGVMIRNVRGENCSLAVIELNARTVVETHKHDEEHLGLVMRGSVVMAIAGEQRILTAGDTCVVPSGAAHGFRVLESDAELAWVTARAS